jgi:hypothetical protein
MDAFTSKEYTCFTLVLDTNVPHAVDLLSDIVLRPLFDEGVGARAEVIVEEIRMVEDAPEELITTCSRRTSTRAIRWAGPSRTEATVKAQPPAIDGLLPRRLRSRKPIDRRGGERRPQEALGDGPQGVRQDEAGGKRLKRGSIPKSHGGVVTRAKKELEQLHLLIGVPAFSKGTPTAIRSSC